MTTVVANPISALSDKLDQVTLGRVFQVYTRFDKVHKDSEVISDEEINRRLFKTSYEPSPEWWSQNQAAYEKPEHDPLPFGFPAKVEHPNVWDGRVLIDQPEKWLYRFTADDIDQIEKAYTHFISLNLPNNSISRATFPIDQNTGLFVALEENTRKVKSGLGFAVLRGLPVNEWKRSKQIIIFAGISSYVSDTRVKQGKQNIVHLRDITKLPVDKRPAITVKGQTAGNQVFHNDGTIGIIGLITIGVAEKGGLSQLASVGQVYNELASSRRDIVRELAQSDWVSAQFPEGKELIFPIEGSGVVSSYSRRPFFGFYEADADAPPLPAHKHLALDAVHLTAEKFSLDLNLEVGDLEYANNLTVYHARTASEDSDVNQRHLIRVHLANPEQALPEHARVAFDKLNEGEAKFGDRNGRMKEGDFWREDGCYC